MAVSMLRATIFLLLVLFSLLEYRFWCGGDSVLQVMKLKRTLQEQQAENISLQARNDAVAMKIASLKKSPISIEEQARYELGMIKRGEKYYQVVEPID